MTTDRRARAGSLLPVPHVEALEERLVHDRLRERMFGTTITSTRVGRYIVVDLLGEGGLGAVYRAYDPELDRRVAVKLVRAEHLAADATAQRNLIKEARAAAKLSNANVVQVYDVGSAQGRVYFAMEFIEGGSLRRWLEEDRRAWRDVLRVFLHAGEGVAAAHEFGIAHRDFKPDNVLISTRGEVKVVDFGLAGELEAPRPTGTPHEDTTSTTGLSGTPAYMAPEVWRGGPADARSDQFSFCVSLFEALYGAHPFGGVELASMRTAMRTGDVSVPTGGAKVPAWLDQVVRRGLRPDPAARYASMRELLTALVRESSTRRRTATVLVGVLGVAMLGGIGYESTRPQLCTNSQEILGTAWEGLGASGRPLRERLDDFAARWNTTQRELCVGAWIDRRVPESVYEQQMACLDGGRRQMEEVVEFVRSHPGARDLDLALSAALRLPAPDDCSKPGRVEPLPSDPELRAAVVALRLQLGRAESVVALDQLDRRSEVEGVAAAAERLGFDPTLARALLLKARIERQAGEFRSAEDALRRAAVAAGRGGRDRVLGEIWSELAVVLTDQSRFSAATEVAQSSVVVLERATDEAVLRSRALRVVGVAQGWELRYGDAIESFHRSIAAAEDAGDAGKPELIESLAALVETMVEMDRDGHGAALYARRGLKEAEGLYGDEHSRTNGARFALGMALTRPGSVDEGVGLMRDAVLADEVHRGAHSIHIYYYYEIATALRRAQRCGEALVDYHRALATARELLGRDDYQAAMVERDMAVCERALGDTTASRGRLERVLSSVQTARGPRHPSAALVLLELAALDIEVGDRVAGRQRLESMLGWLSPSRDVALIDRANVLLAGSAD